MEGVDRPSLGRVAEPLAFVDGRSGTGMRRRRRDDRYGEHEQTGEG
jgi:hypothetical protein